MAMSILALLSQGGALKARKDFGFYVVQHGKEHPVDQKEAMKLVDTKQVRPEGLNQWGVMSFSRTPQHKK
mgnify:CR=1 FL=1